MADDFLKFADNLFKLSYDRRKKEFAQKRLKFADLWLSVPEQSKADPVVLNLYAKCTKLLDEAEALAAADSATPDRTPDPSTSAKKFVFDNPPVVTGMDFEFKTAGSLVPDFDGTSKDLNDFVDCVTYYNGALKATENAKFLDYVLKVKLKGKAKLALTSTPKTLDELCKLLKLRFKPRATVASLQAELSSLQQRDKSVAGFSAHIEDLTKKLTDLQVAEKGEAASDVIKSLNDTLALNVLKMGAKPGIKQVLLASQVSHFTQGVSVALEAECGLPKENSVPGAQVGYMRGSRYQNRRGSNRRGRGGFRRSGGRPAENVSQQPFQGQSRDRRDGQRFRRGWSRRPSAPRFQNNGGSRNGYNNGYNNGNSYAYDNGGNYSENQRKAVATGSAGVAAMQAIPAYDPST